MRKYYTHKCPKRHLHPGPKMVRMQYVGVVSGWTVGSTGHCYECPVCRYRKTIGLNECLRTPPRRRKGALEKWLESFFGT